MEAENCFLPFGYPSSICYSDHRGHFGLGNVFLDLPPRILRHFLLILTLARSANVSGFSVNLVETLVPSEEIVFLSHNSSHLCEITRTAID